MRFYLGTHIVSWLWRSTVPLFLSQAKLSQQHTFKRATAPYAIDSNGFMQLSRLGYWETTPDQYVERARHFRAEIGEFDWIAIQDWMCEPFVIAKTGLSLIEHQRRTVASYARLLDLAPELPWAPVLQGWHADDFLRCADMYAAAGLDLYAAPVVGVGSVCRRQATTEAHRVFARLSTLGLPLHGFGLKTLGLLKCAPFLASSDSMAWSYRARRNDGPLCNTGHRSCSNCYTFAHAWRERIVKALVGRDLGQLALAV